MKEKYIPSNYNKSVNPSVSFTDATPNLGISIHKQLLLNYFTHSHSHYPKVINTNERCRTPLRNYFHPYIYPIILHNARGDTPFSSPQSLKLSTSPSSALA